MTYNLVPIIDNDYHTISGFRSLLTTFEALYELVYQFRAPKTPIFELAILELVIVYM